MASRLAQSGPNSFLVLFDARPPAKIFRLGVWAEAVLNCCLQLWQQRVAKRATEDREMGARWDMGVKCPDITP